MVHEKALERVDELTKQAVREVQPGGRVRSYSSAQRWGLLYQEGEEVTGDVVETIKTVAVQKRLEAYAATKTGQLAGGRVEWQVLIQVVKGCRSIINKPEEGPGGKDIGRLCGDEQGAATKGASGCSGVPNVRATSRRKPLACPHQVQARVDGGNEKRVGGGGHKARAVRGDKAE